GIALHEQGVAAERAARAFVGGAAALADARRHHRSAGKRVEKRTDSSAWAPPAPCSTARIAPAIAVRGSSGRSRFIASTAPCRLPLRQSAWARKKRYSFSSGAACAAAEKRSIATRKPGADACRADAGTTPASPPFFSGSA